MNHIELFAGCGGLSLGLETAGFELVMANELSPMASETFAYNILNADLVKQTNIDKVLWLSSSHKRQDFAKRLRENPSAAIGLKKEHYSDLKGKRFSNEDLYRSLLVGSIIDLNRLLENDRTGLLEQIKNGFGKGSIDLVSGGPPCQSFSMAGLRDRHNERNTLPWEFAKFVGMIQPKIVLLENVSGILRAFSDHGEKYYAWHEVAKAFAKVGYIPLCLHVNAKNVGVAQNRPRFIMIGLREDVHKNYSTHSKDINLLNALKISKLFFDEISKGNSPEIGTIRCFDIDKDRFLFVEGALKNLLSYSFGEYVSVEEAIDDLRSPNLKCSSYVNLLNEHLCNVHSLSQKKFLNHELRANGPKVRARFRLNQVLNKLDMINARELKRYIKYQENSKLDNELLNLLAKYWLLDVDGKQLKNESPKQIKDLLEKLRTFKHSQRALVKHRPAPAVLGSPDDTSHYHESESAQRTLTVRELARIQSFPDWFEFKSKVTTGGQCRKHEVPQYTQVGNAVPPLLGEALGKVCKTIIKSS